MSDDVKGVRGMRQLGLLKQDELEEKEVIFTTGVLALAASDEKRIELERIEQIGRAHV